MVDRNPDLSDLKAHYIAINLCGEDLLRASLRLFSTWWCWGDYCSREKPSASVAPHLPWPSDLLISSFQIPDRTICPVGTHWALAAAYAASYLCQALAGLNFAPVSPRLCSSVMSHAKSSSQRLTWRWGSLKLVLAYLWGEKAARERLM